MFAHSFLKFFRLPALSQNEVKANRFSPERLDALSSKFDFKAETVHLDFNPGTVSGTGFLFVAPRYFRGIGLSEELTAYLEFSRLVSESLQPLMLAAGIEFSLKVLHPQLIDRNGVPAFSGRAPHPALLFTLLKTKS